MTETRIDYPKRLYRRWRFVSPSTGEVVFSLKPAEPKDYDYQHEYQQIIEEVMR